jgi:hypothetical protein
VTNANTVHSSEKQQGKKDGGNESEEEKETMHISHSITLQYVDTLLDYAEQTGFKYSDVKQPGNFVLL